MINFIPLKKKQQDLENKIIKMEQEINNHIYDLYNFNKEEIQHIERSIQIDSVVLRLFP